MSELDNKARKGTFLISIIWVGFSLDPDFDRHDSLIQKKVHRSLSLLENEDKSKLFNRYVLTCKGEPICLNEYCTRIANYKNVHIVELDSLQDDYIIQEEHIDYQCDWNELVLSARPGRANFTLVQDCDLKELQEGIQ